MGYHENMEMERSRRQHEHEKKFGKPRENFNALTNQYEEPNPNARSEHNEALLKRLRHEGSKDPVYPDQHKNK